MIEPGFALGPVAVLVIGGLLSVTLSRRPRLASRIGAGSAVVACGWGFAWSLATLASGQTATWGPWLARTPLLSWWLGADPITAYFSVPVYGLGGLAAIYGFTYLAEWEGRKNLGAAWCGFDLLLAGMAMVLLARSTVPFLLAWEVMSIAAWALVSFEHEKASVRFAGWVYLVVTHASVAVLFVLFLVLVRSGGPEGQFTTLSASAPVTSIVLLALVGFGAKAGLAPLHVWLPEAHAAAPSHVSAIMSGVVVKMGVYGVVRTVEVVGGPPEWLGTVLVVTGLGGALLGIGLALSQRDLKRALAYSTIENVGIVTLALGVAYSGRVHGEPAMAALGAAAALLHAWNHTLMKGLMFLGAGSVLHATGTKDLEALGGLLRRMPRTGALMTLGAAAIAGLPPLNGFAGEWLLYLGLLRGGTVAPGAIGLGFLVALGLLAFAGALAAASFARLIGVAFLGEPRTPEAARAHESPAGLLVPMAVLGVGCVAVGLAPQGVIRLVEPATSLVAGSSDAAAAAALAPLSTFAVGAWASIGAVAGLLALVLGRRAPAVDATWGCGYLEPTPRMQYTARAFGRTTADAVLPPALKPREQVPVVRGLFPGPASVDIGYADPVLDRGYLPVVRRWADRFSALRRLQHGRTHLYIAYIGFVLMLALAWSVASARGMP